MADAPTFWTLYGVGWTKSRYPTEIDVERYLIQNGGYVQSPSDPSVKIGNGLFFHFRRMQSLLWPEDDHHEWSDLILKTMLEERITVVQGPKDSGKTRIISKFALTDYACFPKNTLVLVSSNRLQGMELRVWGDIKSLYLRALKNWPSLPGHAVESLKTITTDDVDEAGLRDLRRGIICVGMRDAQGDWIGLSSFAGVKQARRRLLSDETQLYHPSFLSVLANLDKAKQDFKGLFVGNPRGDLDPLDRLAEPKGGWDSIGDVVQTRTWQNNWDGITINLYGPDSPAIRHPGKYPYLHDQEDIDKIRRRYGEGSFEYFSQGLGVRRPSADARRVFTRDMALQFGVHDSVVWKGDKTTKVYGLDAAYGGDRCVGVVGEFGVDVNDQLVLAIHEPILIPIAQYMASVPPEERLLPEDQIAEAVKAHCLAEDIPAANVFYDATGRGSLGTSFGRRWSNKPNPVECGGSPTNRPVTTDFWIADPRTGERRLKLAREHYGKRITEFWFAFRHAGEARQIRELPESILDEFAKREWEPIAGDRRDVETKARYKEKYGMSPDFADATSIMIEGARRLGFQIARLESATEKEADNAWFSKVKARADRLKASYTLAYSDRAA